MVKSSVKGPVGAPFVKWAGGKRQLLDELLKRAPESYERYVEPFVGGGALFFALSPKSAILIDLNAELINLYRVVKEKPRELLEELSRHRNEEEYYYAVRTLDRAAEFAEMSEVERAGRFLYLNKTGYNGLWRVNSRGENNVPFGRYKNPTIADPDKIKASSAALASSILICGDFSEVEHAARENDFLYLDPPYHPLSATSGFTGYSSGGFSAEDQIRLREMVLRLTKKGVKVMLSNSDTPFIQKLYNGFNVDRVSATRTINCKGAKRGHVSEVIIRNY
ncbi:MAG: modification methylase [Deltaproteobacteria bacterium]|nr:MAG: modification methylase [Deltaproteobacteria bacterium]